LAGSFVRSNQAQSRLSDNDQVVDAAILKSAAKSLAPANFIDVTYLKELEQSGFIKNLYGE
jgi:hypothetical protein